MRCLACVKRASDKCDAACQASELTTRHALWGCVDATKCAAKAPGTDATAWKAWTVYVTDPPSGTDTQGEAYRLVETPLTTAKAFAKTVPLPVGRIPCLDYARVNAQKLNLRMLAALAPYAVAGGALKHKSVADPDRR